jgi:cytoskeletal protein CcmA (bactofilin family)
MSRSPKSTRDQEPRTRRFTDVASDELTLIGAGLRIEGDIEGEDAVDLAGKLEGDVEVGGLVRIREEGRVKGSIKADNVLVEGEVKGESIVSRNKIELRSRARVEADIDAATLAIGEGSFLQGHVHMREGGAGHLPFKERRKE